MLVGSAAGAAPRSDQIVVIVPGCVVDPSDVLGWWRGNGDLTAAIGPDLAGSATFSSSIIGQGITLDGTQTLSVDGFPEVTNGVTVETWLRPTATGTTQTIMSRWDFPSTDDSARSYALFLDPSGRLVWSTDETSTRRPQDLIAEAPQLFNARFHHVAATWTATTMAVYVDGNLVISGPSQGGTLNPATTTQFRLGSKAGLGTTFPFVGVLDEPAVIRRALSATEVQGLVDAGPNAKCLPEPVPVVAAGASAATSGAAARWKGANSGAEVFVGPLLPPSALPRSEADHAWTPGTTFDVTATFNPTANTLTATAGATTAVFDFATQGAPGCPAESWDVLDVAVADSRADAGLRFTGAEIDGIPIGDFGTVDVEGTPGFQAWHVTGFDLGAGFELTGRIEVDGAGFVGNEAMKVQATAGCLP